MLPLALDAQFGTPYQRSAGFDTDTHHTPDDPVGAAKEAIVQAGFMMEHMKVVHDNPQV